VVACRDTGLEWFEQLLQTLFKPKEDKEDATIKNTEPPPQLVLACQQIVDCLVESVLRMEESNFDMTFSEQPNARIEQQNRGMPNNPLSLCQNPATAVGRARTNVAALPVSYLQNSRGLPDHLRRRSNP